MKVFLATVAATLAGIATGIYIDQLAAPGGRDYHAYEVFTRTICDLKDNERAFTTNWAFNGTYEIFPSTGGTIDTWVYRMGDTICLTGPEAKCRKRSGESWMDGSWGCSEEFVLTGAAPEVFRYKYGQFLGEQ